MESICAYSLSLASLSTSNESVFASLSLEPINQDIKKLNIVIYLSKENVLVFEENLYDVTLIDKDEEGVEEIGGYQ
jgi:hypothetical protein